MNVLAGSYSLLRYINVN